MDIKRIRIEKAPARSSSIAWAEIIELTGLHPSILGELIEIGWISPVRTMSDNYLFTARDVYRLRKLDRICRDFELNPVGAGIIVDLLDRIEHLEGKVRELNRLR